MLHQNASLVVVSSLLSTLALGCGSGGGDDNDPTPFESSDDVQTWAQTASALGVYANAYEPIALADAEFGYPDPACPATSDDGDTLTITGDCSDDSGKEWTGSATVQRAGDDRELTFEDFQGTNGQVNVRLLDTSLREFEAHLVIGEVTTIDYTGTVEGGYDERTVWNGSGSVQREGFLSPTGEIEATTAEEVLDETLCAQPASGTTTLHARGETAVITYDGATDCDGDQSARLSVNGQDRGMISGIYCAVRDPGATGSPGLAGWSFAGLAFGSLARRRGVARQRQRVTGKQHIPGRR